MCGSLPGLVGFNPLGRQREHISEGTRVGPGGVQHRGSMLVWGPGLSQVDGAHRSRLTHAMQGESDHLRRRGWDAGGWN